MSFIVRRFFTFKFRISNIFISKFLVAEIDFKIWIKMRKSVYKAINRLFLIWQTIIKTCFCRKSRQERRYKNLLI